jgi:hypothetical protein
MERNRQSVDRATSSYLALCTCGYRQLTYSVEAAWYLLAIHAAQGHGDTTGAAVRNYQRHRKANGT